MSDYTHNDTNQSIDLPTKTSTISKNDDVSVSYDPSAVVTSKDIENMQHVVDKAAFFMPLVAVYCGSKQGDDPVYLEAAHELGKALADNQMGLVYGGASVGLMGAVADTCIQNGSQAVGVIPDFMLRREIAHRGLTRLHLTDTMHTRKAIMAEYADAFVTLPGGLGTLEEIMEIATWRQLFQHEKPMIILNINGYYDRLLAHLRFTAEQGFMLEHDLQRLVVCGDVAQAMTVLHSVVQAPDQVRTDRL